MSNINIKARMDIHAPHTHFPGRQLIEAKRGATAVFNCYLNNGYDCIDNITQVWFVFGQDKEVIAEFSAIEYFEQVEEIFFGGVYYKRFEDIKSASGFSFKYILVEDISEDDNIYQAVEQIDDTKDYGENWQLNSHFNYYDDEARLALTLSAEETSNIFEANDNDFMEDLTELEIAVKLNTDTFIGSQNKDEIIIKPTQYIRVSDSLFSQIL